MKDSILKLYMKFIRLFNPKVRWSQLSDCCKAEAYIGAGFVNACGECKRECSLIPRDKIVKALM